MLGNPAIGLAFGAQVPHGNDGAVEAAKHDDDTVDGRVPVAAVLSQVLQISQHIACRDAIGWTVVLGKTDPVAKLAQGILISGERERPQAPRHECVRM